MTGVPMLDLGWQHERIADRVRAGFDRVCAETSFILGPDVEEFESAFA